MGSPSRRDKRVTRVDWMARAAAERQVRSSGMLHVGYADSIMNDGPRFHLDISDKELPEPVTRAIEVTLPKPLFVLWCMIIHSSILMHAFIHSSHTSKHCICNCCITTLCFASRSGSRLIRYERRPIKVRRPAHGRLKGSRPPRVEQN